MDISPSGIKAIENDLITVVVTMLGHGKIFDRVIAELDRVNSAMPNGTTHEIRTKFIADCIVIFDDLVVPVGEAELRLLFELGLAYISGGFVI